MKRSLSILFTLSVFSLFLNAQSPDWWDNASRSARYPRESYFTGFVLGEQQPGETLEATYTRLKNEARVEAASSIKTLVQKEMSSSNSSVMVQTSTDFDEKVTEVFHSKTNISVSVEIPGLKIDVYQDPRTKEIGAFAYVSRQEILRKTERQITTLLTRLDLTLQNSNQLIATGQKIQARQTAEKALPLFAEIDEHQKLLAAINADPEALQLTETNALRQQFVEQLAKLKYGITIYLSAACDLFGAPYSSLAREILGQLSSMGCEYTKDPNTADWAIYINTSAREYNNACFGSVCTFTAIVDAQITIDKMTTRQRVFYDEIHQNGTHTLSFNEAARQAYKDVATKISSIIKEQIQQ